MAAAIAETLFLMWPDSNECDAAHALVLLVADAAFRRDQQREPRFLRRAQALAIV